MGQLQWNNHKGVGKTGGSEKKVPWNLFYSPRQTSASSTKAEPFTGSAYPFSYAGSKILHSEERADCVSLLQHPSLVTMWLLPLDTPRSLWQKGGGGGAITFSLSFARTPALLKQRSEAPWVAAGSLPQLCIFPAGSVLID